MKNPVGTLYKIHFSINFCSEFYVHGYYNYSYYFDLFGLVSYLFNYNNHVLRHYLIDFIDWQLFFSHVV